MFSGIVQDIGLVTNINKDKGYTITIECNKNTLINVTEGASIACSGVCLTVVAFNNNSFDVQVSEETLAKTTLVDLKIGSYLNLERALKLGDEIGGHLVSGHVDAIGVIKNIAKNKEFWIVEFTPNVNLLKYIVHKGCITIDGVSLTVNDVFDNYFNITIIPHTIENTIFKYKNNGDKVNLEIDLIARYLLNKKDSLYNKK